MKKELHLELLSIELNVLLLIYILNESLEYKYIFLQREKNDIHNSANDAHKTDISGC